MHTTRTCPKCGSNDVIEQVRVVDHSEAGTRDLSVSFPGPKVAGLFRVPREVPLTAWVCASCGYTELYAARPEEIRSMRDRVAAEGRGSAWGSSAIEGEARSRARRVVVIALAAALALVGGLVALLVLMTSGAK